MDVDGPGSGAASPRVPAFLAKIRARLVSDPVAAGSSSAGGGAGPGPGPGPGPSSGPAGGGAGGSVDTSGPGTGTTATSASGTASSPDSDAPPASTAATTPPAPAPAPPPNALYLPPPAVPAVEEDLVPPENFAAVTPGVYRCGFPKKRNFKFLETLQLKTVLTLVLEDYPEANLQWCQDQDIQFMQFGIPGNKEPFDNIPEDVICSALVAILDRRNHPILIHCNKGKHRTGCLIGCIRRLQSWSLTSIFDEYRRFSFPKSRAVDQQFIDLFDIAPVWDGVMSPQGGGLGNLPPWPMLVLPLRLQAARGEMEREQRERARERTRIPPRVEMLESPLVEAVEVAVR